MFWPDSVVAILISCVIAMVPVRSRIDVVTALRGQLIERDDD